MDYEIIGKVISDNIVEIAVCIFNALGITKGKQLEGIIRTDVNISNAGYLTLQKNLNYVSTVGILAIISFQVIILMWMYKINLSSTTGKICGATFVVSLCFLIRLIVNGRHTFSNISTSNKVKQLLWRLTPTIPMLAIILLKSVVQIQAST